MTTRLHNYAEVRAYLEKEHPDWLRALTPRHINAPADYWPQKVLAVSSVNAAMQNYISIYEHQTKPNPALAAVKARRLCFCARTYRLTTFPGNYWLPRSGL
jgi:hypothetical protein